MDERAKADYLLTALQTQVLKSVRDILADRTAPDTTLYDRLKERLLRRFQPSPWQLAFQILHHPGLGDLRPSQLLDAMMALLPAGEQPGYLFKALFLERLPADMKDQLAAGNYDSPREMAVVADRMWDAKRSQPGFSSIAAVRSTSPGRGRSPGRNKSPGRRREATPGRRPGWLCFFHHKYRDQARKCEQPCAWPGNGLAASTN